MKLLHTSDWHLGRALYDKKRYDEFDAFLKWLSKFIADEKIELLLVAGDIFDTSTPSNQAQELYYGFLARIRESGCRNVIITGGNHDSPTFLDAPKHILGALQIKVVGAITGNTEDEICKITDENGNLEAIVCAVPFLRDRDIRTVESGESADDKSRKLKENIAAHYSKIFSEAQNLQGEKKVPVVAMGHLFTREGRTSEGDGVRELYIGSIAHIDEEDISNGFDYVALGHLHMAQVVGINGKVRYSGSPIPMGFAEAGQKKKVVVVGFNDCSPSIVEHEIPCFRELVKISGTLEEISVVIAILRDRGSKAWLEIEVNSQADSATITSRLDELLENTELEVLRIKNRGIIQGFLSSATEELTLETMEDRDVFIRCLEASHVPAEEHQALISTYDEAIRSMQSLDINAY
jgi:DNA repair protein SbcD/Mre11